MRHFGDDQAPLNEVIPGYEQVSAERPDAFSFLNFL